MRRANRIFNVRKTKRREGGGIEDRNFRHILPSCNLQRCTGKIVKRRREAEEKEGSKKRGRESQKSNEKRGNTEWR